MTIKQLLIRKRNAGEFTNRPRAEGRGCHLWISVFGAVAALDHASGGDCRWQSHATLGERSGRCNLWGHEFLAVETLGSDKPLERA